MVDDGLGSQHGSSVFGKAGIGSRVRQNRVEGYFIKQNVLKLG
jgi:hypothetical protein